MKIINVLCKSVGILLIAGTLYGCASNSQQRKKMPAFAPTDAFEGLMPFEAHGNSGMSNNTFGFTSNNVDMTFEGNTKQFALVSLPDASYDQQALGIINSFKPLALPMLSAWAQQQKGGVAIDLASHTNEVYRTEYVIEKEGDFTIPVVIIWDQASASRVAAIKNIAEGIPAIKITCSSGYNPGK